MKTKISKTSIKKEIKKNLIKNLFELNKLKGLSLGDLINKKDDYRSFWELFIKYNNQKTGEGITKLKFDDINKDQFYHYVHNKLRLVYNDMHNDKLMKLKIKDINDEHNIGYRPIQDSNHNKVIYSETIDKIKQDKHNKLVTRNISKTITEKKIERIEFSSPTTIESINSIMKMQKAKNEWLDDYKLALDSRNNGVEYKGKTQFYHMALGADYVQMGLTVADLIKNRNNLMNEDDGKEIDKIINNKMKDLSKIYKIMQNTREIELDPLRISNIFNESGLNQQKEIFQAVANDSQMVSLGNIVSNNPLEVEDKNKIKDKMKQAGFGEILDEAMSKMFENVGGYKQEDKIENIIETEEFNNEES